MPAFPELVHQALAVCYRLGEPRAITVLDFSLNETMLLIMVLWFCWLTRRVYECLGLTASFPSAISALPEMVQNWTLAKMRAETACKECKTSNDASYRVTGRSKWC